MLEGSAGKKIHVVVSIIIPVYNGSKYIREAIDSALAQTYKNIEIIVVNDGSADDTEEIVKSYANRVRYFSKENGGVSSALNVGLREMKGDYFSWLSHDDVYYPNKIERQIAYLNSLKNKDVVLYSNYTYIDENSKTIRTVELDHNLLEKKPELALLNGFLNGCTILIPKIAFDKYGIFDEKLKCTQDYDMWSKMMETYKFVHIPEVLTKYRVHPMQDSKKSPNAVVEGDALYIKMIENLPLNRKNELEGSELEFYKQMIIYLKQTPYKNAMEFANKKANQILAKEKKPAVDFTKAFVMPKKNELKDKIRFALFSPKKLLKKYYCRFHV